MVPGPQFAHPYSALKLEWESWIEAHFGSLTFFKVTPCLMANIRLFLRPDAVDSVLGAAETFRSCISPRCNEASTSSIVPAVTQDMQNFWNR